MKVLISSDGFHAHYFERLAVARVFASMGYEAVMWDISKKSAFDAFDDLNPDLFIGQTYNLNDAVAKCIALRPNMKVIMKGSDWGPISDKIDRVKYPVLIANDEEIERVIKLKEKTGKPDFLTIHYHDDRLESTHGHWIKNGVPVQSFMNAADIFDYTNGRFRDEYASDLTFVGGFWGYKGVTLSRWLLPLCQPNKGLNIKIFGNSPWSVPQYCGFLQNEEVKHAFASARICPNISEPHSQDFGYDIIERPFKLLSNKCFVISDYVEDMEKVLKDGIVFAKSPQEFEELCRKYLELDSERMEIANRGYQIVMGEHTYFHRVFSILTLLGLFDEVNQCATTFEAVTKKLGL